MPAAEVASRLGYESEAAFSRAFKRVVGISPGADRQRAPSVRKAWTGDAGASEATQSPV